MPELTSTPIARRARGRVLKNQTCTTPDLQYIASRTEGLCKIDLQTIENGDSRGPGHAHSQGQMRRNRFELLPQFYSWRLRGLESRKLQLT